MKKYFSVILTALIIFTSIFTFAACTPKEEEEEPQLILTYEFSDIGYSVDYYRCKDSTGSYIINDDSLYRNKIGGFFTNIPEGTFLPQLCYQHYAVLFEEYSKCKVKLYNTQIEFIDENELVKYCYQFNVKMPDNSIEFSHKTIIDNSDAEFKLDYLDNVNIEQKLYLNFKEVIYTASETQPLISVTYGITYTL